MRAGTVARVYAETLLREAERTDALAEVDEGFRAFDAVVRGDAGLRRFLAAPQIDAGRKYALLERVFEGRLHPALLRFLRLVVEKHREPLLEEMADAWRELQDARAGRESATLTTAVEIDEALVERIREALEERTGKTISLERRVDPRLLGGVVVRAGDTVMDGSLRRRLHALRNRWKAASAAPVAASPDSSE